MTKGYTLYCCLLLATAWIPAITLKAQGPSTCATVTNRANSNGGANSCPNVNGTAYALNFVGTSYATVPATAKTGNLTITYPGILATLTPYAVTKVWITTTSTSLTATTFGPAGVPSVSGGNTQVSYCFYGANLPTAGTLSLQFVDPVTGIAKSICSYDASCTSNCALVANPTNLVLPVKYAYFNGRTTANGSVNLEWATAQEENNKGFSIERSAADSSFAPIAFIPSSNTRGNSSTLTGYSFTDHPTDAGRLSYRIKQIDLDGNNSYSDVLEVTVPGNKVSARIFTEGQSIRILMPTGSQRQPYDVLVYDTQGRTLRHQHSVTTATAMITGLPEHSIYYVEILEKNGKEQILKAVYLN
jgi:hypothetical protein